MSAGILLRTPHHIYLKTDCVGIGASSIVYKAYQSKTGYTRAAKVLKDKSKYNLQDLTREVAALRQLNHPNIIKFYGQEKELKTGREVLILSYCHTSLHYFLLEPENFRGLGDKEFLCLLSDLCSAVSYLTNNGIIHRDLKPGNILRDIKPDLSPIYIISDFGTSRNLEKDGTYFSLVGTEEFLHPAVYEKAFVNSKLKTPFTNRTELWSLGCILYQAIANRMPFIPFNGARKNRMVMYEMLVCKPTGSICGYQNEPDGPVIWLKSFPTNCLLSRNLQDIMKSVISSLMESEPKKQTNHEELFTFQNQLDNKLHLELINTTDGTSIELYLDPTKSFTELQEQIAKYTDVHSDQQLLFYQDILLNNVVQQGYQLSQIFHKSQTQIFTLVIKDKHGELEKYNLDPFPVYNNSNTVKTDDDVTLKCCQIVVDIGVLVSQSFKFQQIIPGVISSMRTLLKSYSAKVEKNFECLSVACTHYSEQITLLEMWCSCQFWVIPFLHHQSASTVMDLKGSLQEMRNGLSKVAKIVKLLTTNNEMFQTTLLQINDSCTSQCVQKSQKYLEKIKIVSQRIKQRTKCEVLQEEDKILHLRDRTDGEELNAGCLCLWQDHCWLNKQRLFNRFTTFKRCFIEGQQTAKDANRLMVNIRQLSNKLVHTLSQIHHQMFKWSCPRLMNMCYSIGQLEIDDRKSMKIEEKGKLKQHASQSPGNSRFESNNINKRTWYSDEDVHLPKKVKGVFCECGQEKRNYTRKLINMRL